MAENGSGVANDSLAAPRVFTALDDATSTVADKADPLVKLLSWLPEIERWIRRLLPLAFAGVVVAGVLLVWPRVELLTSWNSVFSGTGKFTVIECDAYHDPRGPDQWHCPGRLTLTGATEAHGATMVVSKDALVSFRPYVGQQWSIFFESPPEESADPSRVPEYVYAQPAQLFEMTRLYVSILPRLLVLFGALAWLLGWGLKELSSRTGGRVAWWDRMPFRFAMQRQGIAMIVVGVLTYFGYRLLLQFLLGSVGVA